jgi:hypothetical protein
VEAYIRGNTATVETKDLPKVYGCAVVLRLAGVVVGRGSSIGGPGVEPTSFRIGAAAELALIEAERQLPVRGEGAARAAMVKELKQNLLISLELSGPLMRINANAYDDFNATLQPGIDGALAVMEGKVGAVFPGAAASGSVTPGDAVRRAVGIVAANARGDEGGGAVVAATEPAELEKKQGVTLYRFRTAHLAQWQADKSPELLYRGQRLVEQQDIDGIDELWHMADRLAGGLINRLGAQPAGGTLSLATGAGEEPDAFAAALARHALLAYWNKRSGGHAQRGADDPVRTLTERSHAAAQDYLPIARERMKRTDDKDRLAASAVIVKNYDAKNAPEFVWLDERLSAGKEDVPAGLRGLVIWGRDTWGDGVEAGAAAGRPDPHTFHPSEAAVRKLMAETPVSALPSEMPWLGWTDLAVDEWLKRPGGKKSASALREMRTLIWKHQLQGVDAGPDTQDMVGGIVVPGSKSPLPTWQTARMVAFLGTMLGEPELTSPQERGGEVVRLLGAARFLRQLQVDDSLGWMCKEPVMVKGGLRNATWDQRTQIDATAMGLLAVMEIIGGIEKASGK